MKTNLAKIKTGLISIGYWLLANRASAQGLVSCENNCSVCDLLILGNDVIGWITKMAFVLGAGFFAWGALVIITAGSSEKQLEDGKSLLKYTVIGIFIILIAFLIVSTLLRVLTGSPSVIPWSEIQCINQ